MKKTQVRIQINPDEEMMPVKLLSSTIDFKRPAIDITSTFSMYKEFEYGLPEVTIRLTFKSWYAYDYFAERLNQQVRVRASIAGVGKFYDNEMLVVEIGSDLKKKNAHVVLMGIIHPKKKGRRSAPKDQIDWSGLAI